MGERGGRWRARWQHVPLRWRVVGWIGAAVTVTALVMTPWALADRRAAAALAERGVTTTATRVRAHVADQPKGPQFDAVEVTFTTSDGVSVTTELGGITGYGTTAGVGWHEDWPGYEEPLRVRYDAADPTLAMAESDYEFERAYPFLAFTIALGAVGVALAIPAARAFRRAAADAGATSAPAA